MDFQMRNLEEYFQNGLYRTVGYSKGAIIYCQDELCKSLDVVLEGSASAQKIDNEGNVLISSLQGIPWVKTYCSRRMDTFR